MITTHQAQVPKVVADYFGAEAVRAQHPIVEQEFHPTATQVRTQRGVVTLPQGWRTQTHYRKRISVAWARKLKGEGVERVALRCGARLADFGVAKIIRGGIA